MSDRAQLFTAVREAISIASAKSRVNARKVAEFVCDRNPELVLRHGRNLALDALTSVARKEIKRWQATGTSASEQLCLPNVLLHLVGDLPPAVWVPDEDGEGSYRTFNGADPITCGELQAAVLSLESQIIADTKKCAALKELLAFTKAFSAKPNDPVLNILRKTGESA